MSRQSTVPTRYPWLILGIGLALVALMALRTVPVHADPEDPTPSIDMRLTQAVTVYAEPDANSAVVAILQPGTVVTGVGRQRGADGALWQHVTTPGGEGLSWMRIADFMTGAPVFDIGGF